MPERRSDTVMVDCADVRLPVAVQFQDRKRLSISVHPDGVVTALAPAHCTIEDVAAHLRRRQAWIARQRRQFENYQPLPDEKRYVAGETHLYLGRQYRLRLDKSEATSVKLVGRFFHVYVPDIHDTRSIAGALEDWYHEHANAIFKERLRYCLDVAPSLRAFSVQFRIRLMKRRWGSCSQAGRITLNRDLVKAPIHCIEYVILHELCHLVIHDHSPAFFRLLGRFMPDWKKRKERLDSFVIR